MYSFDRIYVDISSCLQTKLNYFNYITIRVIYDYLKIVVCQTTPAAECDRKTTQETKG